MAMNDPRPDDERLALNLPLREWLIVGLVVTALLAVAPHVPFRGRAPQVERDYRIPYALSSRYDLYRRYTTLAAAQYPVLLIGDSVVWGQCSKRNDTLAHHLNELVKQPRFANAGLDGMHPVALAELLEYHAPSVTNTRVVLQFDPLWLMIEALTASHASGALYNRPDLIPRLAAHFTGPFKEAVSLSWSHVARNSPLKDWGERIADTRIDFLAWSLDHPYESPLKAITTALPPSEDSHPQRLAPWNERSSTKLFSRWTVLAGDPQWAAFQRILNLMERRNNQVLVVLGPMNEHMMDDETLKVYLQLKEEMAAQLKSRGVRLLVAGLLPSAQFADICHPLGSGYAGMAQELLQKESAWLLR